MRIEQEYFEGCLLGGAVGDALGAPIEFATLNEIKDRFGKDGITGFPKNPGQKAQITDDTQMTMFTAEGLLRAVARWSERGICHPPSIVHHAYIRWLHTQNEENRYLQESFGRETDDGWLINIKELHHRRAPGNTCLSAMRSKQMGTIEEPINDSKGCGGVMRIAPVGLIVDPPFTMGCSIAAITHSHPCGYLSGGVLAQIIANINSDMSLEQSIEQALGVMAAVPRHEECLKTIRLAMDLFGNGSSHEANIRKIGHGWVGEEALAIAIYCSLSSQSDFRQGVCMAVNHDGDSDSTGSITGNILGAYLGRRAIPPEWLESVELAEEITQLADDLLIQYKDDEEWKNRYPGW